MMLKKIHNILGKLFLSGASFFWASCDSGTSADKPSAFIDVDKELAKLTTTDTTGLRGSCIPEYEYCEMVDGWGNYYSAQAHAADIAIKKLEEQHKDIPNFWYGNYRCYRDILGSLGNTPEYGVPACPSDLTPCQIEEPGYSLYKGVRIDDAYIEALLQKQKEYYETVKTTLEKINQGMGKCPDIK